MRKGIVRKALSAVLCAALALSAIPVSAEAGVAAAAGAGLPGLDAELAVAQMEAAKTEEETAELLAVETVEQRMDRQRPITNIFPDTRIAAAR